MIGSLPDDAFVLRDRHTVGLSQIVEPVILGVDGVFFDERPLFEKLLEIDGVLFAVAFVHHEQSVQIFAFDPPLFFWCLPPVQMLCLPGPNSRCPCPSRKKSRDQQAP